MSECVRLTCVQRDEILGSPISEEWGVESGVTDACGKFGEPRIETTWCRGTERVRDVRHPALGQYAPTPERPDVRPCEHFYWIEEASNE